MKDKVTNKQVIKYMMDKCQESSGTTIYSKRVKILRDFICLEIPELKVDIFEKERQLRNLAELKMLELFEEDKNDYLHPYNRKIYEISINEKRYVEFNIFLNDLIKEHDNGK